VFDNDLKKEGAYFSDQKYSMELKTEDKISLSLVLFYKYMSNLETNILRFWMATQEKLLIFRKFALNYVLLSFWQTKSSYLIY
jgi:hypothetical protein